VEGKENHPDSAGNPETVVAVVEDSAEIAGSAAAYSSYPIFLFQDLSFYFYHHGHDLPWLLLQALDLSPQLLQPLGSIFQVCLVAMEAGEEGFET
jgi:hypothetical protein